MQTSFWIHAMSKKRLNLKKKYTKAELQDFVNELVLKRIFTEQEAEAVNINKLEKFSNSKLADDIREAKEIYKEKPFYMYIPAKDIYGVDTSEKVVVQGIIDLYYIDKNGEIVLVDYKTDYVENGDEESLAEKYRSQILMYKKAIEEATKENVSRVYIYSLYLEKEIEIK